MNDHQTSGICHTCAGSGQLLAMNSGFRADGVRRYRCGICGGSGHSRYRSGEYEREQRDLRATFAGAKP